MPKYLLQLSIRSQLTLMIFIVMAVAIFCITVIHVYWKADELKKNTVIFSQSIASSLGQDAVQVILLDSADAASDMALKLESFDRISQAVFFNMRQEPVFQYKRDSGIDGLLEYQSTDYTLVSDEFIIAYVSLQYHDRTYGTAAFRINLESLRESLFVVLKKEMMLVPILLVISYLFAVFFHRVYTRPLENIVSALHKYGEDQSIGLMQEKYNTRELNELVDSFNNMAKGIEYAQGELEEQRERLHVTLDSIADGVMVADMDGNITFMNPAAEYITGWFEKEVKAKQLDSIYQVYEANADEPWVGLLNDTLTKGTVQFSEDGQKLRVRKGDFIDVNSTVSPIRDADNDISGAVVIFQNVTATRKLTKQLHHQATHDSLTGLVNRGEFERLLSEYLVNISSKDEHALLYLDLDQFKLVNDTAGHFAGDTLLKQIASLLHHSIRDTDIVARLGGDEFAILLPKCSIIKAENIAEKIRNEISNFSFVWEESQFRVGVSIGLVSIDHEGMTLSDVLSNADVACYAAKDLGRNRVHIYSHKDQELMHRHVEMHWVSEIRNALEENRLVLFAQKVVPIRNTDYSVHLELLVRYMDNNGVLRTPGVFIPAIERYGMSAEFDRWIIKSALEEQTLITYLKSSPNRCVNINLSGLTLSDKGLVDYISDLLNKAGLPPRTVCFEITETAAVANFDITKKIIRKMKLLGCDFALDDFGSGVSSFAYLKNLPVDYLKIDGSLIHDIDQNPVNEAMVSAINQVGHVMNMKTVAEFVENRDIQDKLAFLGIDYAQGYYVHVPAPLQEVIEGDVLCSEKETNLSGNVGRATPTK